MATKAELEKQLVEAQAALAEKPTQELKQRNLNIDQAQKALGIKLVGLGGTKDKKIQAIQADIISLTTSIATTLRAIGAIKL